MVNNKGVLLGVCVSLVGAVSFLSAQDCDRFRGIARDDSGTRPGCDYPYTCQWEHCGGHPYGGDYSCQEDPGNDEYSYYTDTCVLEPGLTWCPCQGK